MITAPRSLGNHAYFFRDSSPFTVPQAGTASRTAKPGADDPAWVDLGVISSLSISPESAEDEIYAPSPGTLELYDVVENKRKRTIKFDCDELSFLSFELAFHTKPQTAAGGPYVPGSGPSVKGWLKVEQYDQNTGDNSEPTNVFDSYVHMKLDGELKFDEHYVKTGIQARCLRSSLNSGELVMENPPV
jgi:hypothetical protein